MYNEKNKGKKDKNIAQGKKQKVYPIENKDTMHKYSYEVSLPKKK